MCPSESKKDNDAKVSSPNKKPDDSVKDVIEQDPLSDRTTLGAPTPPPDVKAR